MSSKQPPPPPLAAAISTLQTGFHHLKEPYTQTLLKSIWGGFALSVAGMTALLLATGLSEAVKEAAPVLPRVLQGSVFPVGLVVVYLTGGELYTGYPMWYTLTALSHLTNPQTHGRLTPRVLLAHLLGPMTTWFGNLIGALFVSYVMSICTETLTSEPYASGVKEMIMSEISEPAWGVLILKAVGCGWIVSLAMYMSELGSSQISRVLGLWLPFFLSTTAKWPHTVEYMYLGSLGLGSQLMSPEGYGLGTFAKAMGIISLGNAIGGGLGMGGYLWMAFLWGQERKAWWEGVDGTGEEGQVERDEEA